MKPRTNGPCALYGNSTILKTLVLCLYRKSLRMCRTVVLHTRGTSADCWFQSYGLYAMNTVQCFWDGMYTERRLHARQTVAAAVCTFRSQKWNVLNISESWNSHSPSVAYTNTPCMRTHPPPPNMTQSALDPFAEGQC
jgi:hypothetical protein